MASLSGYLEIKASTNLWINQIEHLVQYWTGVAWEWLVPYNTDNGNIFYCLKLWIKTVLAECLRYKPIEYQQAHLKAELEMSWECWRSSYLLDLNWIGCIQMAKPCHGQQIFKVAKKKVEKNLKMIIQLKFSLNHLGSNSNLCNLGTPSTKNITKITFLFVSFFNKSKIIHL